MNKLFIVGVPIGNSKDITLRAIETLKAVNFIACEDTRQTKKLLSLLGIDFSQKTLIAHHVHNERNSVKGVIEILKTQSVALVSDAGMPVVSDPGFLLIKETIQKNIKIEVIPGPSSVNSAFVLSNFSNKYSFYGFLKPKTGQRQNELKKFLKGSHVIFLSPHRIIRELEDIKSTLGADVSVFVVRELTKKFETHYRGSIDDIIKDIGDNPKGEFTCVINIE